MEQKPTLFSAPSRIELLCNYARVISHVSWPHGIMHAQFKNIQELTDDRIATTALPLVYRPLPITLVTAHSIHIYVCTVYASSTKTSTIKSIQQVNIRKYTHTYVNTCSTLVHMYVCTLYCNIVRTVCEFSSHVCCTYVCTYMQSTYIRMYVYEMYRQWSAWIGTQRCHNCIVPLCT